MSSPALAEIAKRYGFDSEETLTGFKYIGKVQGLLFGFEEALGYLVDPDKVRDKDGISAAIVFLDLVRNLKNKAKHWLITLMNSRKSSALMSADKFLFALAIFLK